MRISCGELFFADEDEKRKTLAVSRKIVTLLDEEGPVSFQIGLNAMVIVIASALSAEKFSNEKNIKLIDGIKDAVLANITIQGRHSEEVN
jgi:hypothetical protein